MLTARTTRAERRAMVAAVAVHQSGVLTRPQIRALGITPAQMQAEEDADRWLPVGRFTLAVGPLGPDADQRIAVLECAPRSAADGRPRAALAGVSALEAGGLRGVGGDGLIHVVAPKSSRPLPPQPGVRVHETRRWRDDDVIDTGIWRARPAVAIVQAALWARTDREAALLIVAPLQQRMARPDDVADVLDRVQRDRRRGLLRAALTEAIGGVHSLNELDFAVMCRRRGLPEPDRQVIVESATGRSYLDVRWRRWRVVVEIDGIGHLEPGQWIEDSVRHNEIAIAGDLVLRVPSLGFRLDPGRHLDAVERALRAQGWRP